MSKVSRWSALALFCLVFGFVGSVGGMTLMQDDLRGEAGVEGPPGPNGAQGPAGETGPAGASADSRRLEADLVHLELRIRDLENWVEDDCAMVTRLVTDVSTLGVVNPILSVSKTPVLVCVHPSR